MFFYSLTVASAHSHRPREAGWGTATEEVTDALSHPEPPEGQQHHPWKAELFPAPTQTADALNQLAFFTNQKDDISRGAEQG